jgi:hypothetical protein
MTTPLFECIADDMDHEELALSRSTPCAQFAAERHGNFMLPPLPKETLDPD